MNYRPNFIARGIDLVAVPASALLFLGDPLVFLSDPLTFAGSSSVSGPTVTYACQDCDPPDPGPARILDVIYNPLYDPEVTDDPMNQFWTPVVAVMTGCGKDWQQAEEYIDFDFGTGGIYHRLISREFSAVITGMSDCDGENNLTGFDCHRFPDNFVFDPVKQRWVASYAGMALGTLGLEIWGTYDGHDEHWFVEYTGCGAAVPPAVNAGEVLIMCLQPLRLRIGANALVAVGCCGDESFFLGRIDTQAFISPVFFTKGIEAVRADDSVQAVAAYGECCALDECPFEAGCCDAILIDASIGFTVFDFAITGTGCADCCTGDPVIGATDDHGCSSLSLTCGAGLFPTTVTISWCLICDVDESVGDQNRGWEHYKLLVNGTDFYSPVEGNCDPFSITFEGITVDISSLLGLSCPGLTCFVTFSLTVTN